MKKKTAIAIDYYKDLALQKQSQHRKFLAQLKRKPPKNLDKIVQEVHYDVFQEIDCKACANCCQTLGPLFTETDIKRISKHFRMKMAAFEDLYLEVDEDGDKVFNQYLVPSWVKISYVVFMMFVLKPVVNSPTQTVRKSTKLTI
ncbi:Uncharacterised protein [Streptococcus pseudoporcinus]|uniref:Fe-S-cluster oxidoreductase n=1 Tax=Streptococcus pseudoporcinus TaxID=361101 RepID=A0A4V6L1C1_9STRE|nr:Uncharacterised protein [Streptococcus pseudoporcinus]